MKNIGIVVGSHRKQSQSGRVAQYLRERLELVTGMGATVLTLADLGLPWWDDRAWTDPKWSEVWGTTSKQLHEMDGFVVVTPEWSGMVPPMLSNLFILCEAGELAHKPALIVSVSASSGGAYPVSQLRAFTGKNTRICYIPEHIILRNVENSLTEHAAPNNVEKEVRMRIDYSLQVLERYAMALKSVRAMLPQGSHFPFGM